MKPESQQIAIAEACGVADRFVLLKRGLYWRPSAHGYTSNISEAWMLTEAEADKLVYPHDEPVTKERVPPPSYLSDLNAMHEAEKVLTQEQRDRYANFLFGMLHDYPDDYAPVWAMTATQRAEAFLRTLSLWDDSK